MSKLPTASAGGENLTDLQVRPSLRRGTLRIRKWWYTVASSRKGGEEPGNRLIIDVKMGAQAVGDEAGVSPCERGCRGDD